LKWGTGGINIDGCRVETEDTYSYSNGAGGNGFHGGVGRTPDGSRTDKPKMNPQGRFPANLIHDGSDEVVSGFPNNANRFFYTPKASKAERNKGLEGFEEKVMGRNQSSLDGGKMLTGSGNERSNKKQNHHPTVKPIALMQYLCRLITPTGGTVLDPYMGSGSTGVGAKEEGFDFIGIELDEEYFKICEARINSVEETNHLL